MADIFKEVDEADRQDRLEEFWARYRVLIYGGIGLIVSSVAGWEAFKWNKSRVENERMLSFERALSLQESNEYEAAVKVFEVLVEDNSALSPMVAHHLANLQRSQLDDPAAALTTLRKISDNDSVFGHLALLKLGYEEADNLDYVALREMLQPILDQESYLSALAIELVAVKAFSVGNIADAKSDFARLESFESLPENLTARVERAIATLKAYDVASDTDQPSLRLRTSSDVTETAQISDPTEAEMYNETTSEPSYGE